MKESEHETETVESESKSSKKCQDISWNILFVIYICMLALKGDSQRVLKKNKFQTWGGGTLSHKC